MANHGPASGRLTPMADISDVMTKMAQIVDAAIYPNGDGQPSALPGSAVCKIGLGWPLPASLDASMAAGAMQITLYPLSGSAMNTYQILDQTYVISEPVIATAVSLSGDVLSVTGTLAAGEFLTLVIDGDVICSQGGATVAAMLAAIAAQAVAAGYAASSTATTLTIPFGHSLVVRQGGQAVLGKVIHRQRSSIMVCIWAPSDGLRTQA